MITDNCGAGPSPSVPITIADRVRWLSADTADTLMGMLWRELTGMAPAGPADTDPEILPTPDADILLAPATRDARRRFNRLTPRVQARILSTMEGVLDGLAGHDVEWVTLVVIDTHGALQWHITVDGDPVWLHWQRGRLTIVGTPWRWVRIQPGAVPSEAAAAVLALIGEGVEQ